MCRINCTVLIANLKTDASKDLTKLLKKILKQPVSYLVGQDLPSCDPGSRNFVTRVINSSFTCSIIVKYYRGGRGANFLA